jgi:hypothetical protein
MVKTLPQLQPLFQLQTLVQL